MCLYLGFHIFLPARLSRATSPHTIKLRGGTAPKQESPGNARKNGGGDGDSTQPPTKRKERSRAVVPDGKRARRNREKTGAGGGGSVTALTEVREWEAESAARNVAD